jgi:hypothetical protein
MPMSPLNLSQEPVPEGTYAVPLQITPQVVFKMRTCELTDTWVSGHTLSIFVAD